MGQDNSQTAKTLTQAIAMQEGGGKLLPYTNISGDEPNAPKGTAGGRYQYTANTWKNYAGEVLGDANAPMTDSNQNQVTYTMLKKWLDAGRTPAQAASMWNAGQGEPDAWTGKFSNGSPSKTNKFDVPDYVKNVQKYAQQIAAGTAPQAEASPVPKAEASTEPAPKDNFLVSLAKGIVEPAATMLARPVQAGAELMGASAEDVNKATQNIAGDWVAPVPQSGGDVLKDIGRGMQTAALGMPVESIGNAALMGAVSGAGSGLEQTGTIQGAATQGLLGAGLGAAGGGVSKFLQGIPARMTENAFKGLSPEEIQKVLQEKTIGSQAGLVNQSKRATAKLATQIDQILSNTSAQGAGDFAIRATKTQFPEYAAATNRMLQKIKSIIPAGYDTGLAGIGRDRATILSYIDKIAEGTATLFEKNKVRSAIDAATSGGYAKLARAVNPSAGQDLAMTFASALRNEVKQSEPATAPLFEELAKEMNIKKVLSSVAKKKSGGLLTWSDIVPYLGGSSIGGIPGGLLSAAAYRAARSPATEFGVAKGIQGLSSVASPGLSRAGLLSAYK